MDFPYLSGAGLYRSELSEYRNLKQSPLRNVTEYEIELFCDDYRYGIVDGVQVPYRRGTVLIAKPGNRRCSRFHFSCYYLHVTVRSNYLETQAKYQKAISLFLINIALA